MILSTVIQEPGITLTSQSDNFTIGLSSQIVNPSIVLTPLAQATIPIAFEQRVTDLENWTQNGTMDGGIIM